MEADDLRGMDWVGFCNDARFELNRVYIEVKKWKCVMEPPCKGISTTYNNDTSRDKRGRGGCGGGGG